MRYLSNVDRDGKDEHRTYVAALRSGMNVRYLDCPMPELYGSGWYGRNLAAGNLNYMGCIVSFDRNLDHSSFWEEWRKLGD